MKLLIDTHILLWAAAGTLPLTASKYIGDEANELFFSSASIWEIAIKQGLGRKDFIVNVHLLHNGLINNGYNELFITSKHALAVNTLPPLHKDPFDRILLAQAITEGIHLITSDSIVTQYTAPIIYVP